MPSIGARTAALLNRIARLRRGGLNPENTLDADLLLVARAIHARALVGEITTLRQLHTITGLSQRAALKAVAELEQTEMLVIDREGHDPLGSMATLTDAMRTSLKIIDRSKAA